MPMHNEDHLDESGAINNWHIPVTIVQVMSHSYGSGLHGNILFVPANVI